MNSIKYKLRMTNKLHYWEYFLSLFAKKKRFFFISKNKISFLHIEEMVSFFIRMKFELLLYIL